MNDLRLSGGVNVILQHCRQLSQSPEISVALYLRDPTIQPWVGHLTENLRIVPREEWVHHPVDIAIATYWETLLHLGEVRATSYVWFCQLYEDRFFPDRNPSISTMQVAGSIPIPVVTEANWLKNLLLAENPDRRVEVVVNGIDKEVFFLGEVVRRNNQFRVLIEGSIDAVAKNTEFAIQGSLLSKHATEITHIGNRPYETNDLRYKFLKNNLSFTDMASCYRSHHLQVKTPIAEGMFGPPLEGFHCGLPAIVTPVTGAEEYIVDGKNSLITLWDDPQGLARKIDQVASNEELWGLLQRGALETAEDWPDWATQGQKFHRALVEVAGASKLTQHDLANLGRTIGFADMMHWLAMRRLSDKSSGPRLLEEQYISQLRKKGRGVLFGKKLLDAIRAYR